MEKNHNILNQLIKNKQPGVPDNFFENFEDKLMSNIETSILNELKKTKQPVVPKHFFNDFVENLPLETKKKGKIISLKTIVIITAVAASLLLLFVLNLKSESQPIVNDDTHPQIENQINTVVVEQNEDYLAMLDEADMVEFIIDNQIDINDIPQVYDEDELFDELSDELDDYIYEL